MSNIEDPCVVLVHASRSSVALRLHVHGRALLGWSEVNACTNACHCSRTTSSVPRTTDGWGAHLCLKAGAEAFPETGASPAAKIALT